MACENDPGPTREDRRKDTVCHMCKVKGDTSEKSCGYCPVCCHWFCKDCNGRIFARGMAAVKQMVGGRKQGCCGPEAAQGQNVNARQQAR